MQIRCNHCGHNFELDEAYDNYAGEVKCWVCGAILEIKMKDGYLMSSRSAHALISVAKSVKQQRSLA